MKFDDSFPQSLSRRVLPLFEQGDLRPLLKDHQHIYDPKLQVLEFRNCIVNRFGVIRLPSGEILADVAYREVQDSSVEQLSNVDPDSADIRTIEEPVILVAGHNNYYHWHLNWLPRLVLADRFEDLRHVKPLIHASPSSFVLESMAQITGRAADDFLTLDAPLLRLSHVYVPAMFLNPLHAPFALRAYQMQRKAPKAGEGKRIYISRAKAPTRRVLNDEAVADLLKGYGYETIAAETMSYADQVVLFSQAEHIVGAHGAGLTNMLFCSPGFSVIELFNEYYTRVYWSLSIALGGSHYRQVSSSNLVPPEGETDPIQAKKNADFTVDLEKLSQQVALVTDN